MKISIYSFFCAFASVLLFSCGGKEEQKELVEVVRPIKYGKVIRSGSSINQEYSGTVQSSKETKLSFKVNGNISSLPVKVGDRVRKGQLIARIDATDLQVQLEQSKSSWLSAETQIKSAQTQLTTSRANYERVEKLYENNSVSLSEFEQVKAALETAEAAYNAAVASAAASEKVVESSSNQVSYSRLLAPFSGVITSINVEENEFVGAGSPIAVLNAINNPEVRVGIPEVVIANVKKGQEVDVHFSVLAEKDFSGKVSEVGFSTAGGSTYPVIIRLDNPSEDIRPGMAAHVHFDFSESDTKKGPNKTYVPVAAVGKDHDSNFVYLLVQNNNVYTVQKKPVKIGPLSSSGFEVVEGVKDGDLVATSGLKSLLEGMKVKLMENE